MNSQRQSVTGSIDRSKLRTGDSVVIQIETEPGESDDVVESLTGVDSVECIFQTFEPRIVVHAFVDDQELAALFDDVVDEQKLRNYEVQKVANSIWNPQIDEADLATECVQCGKPIEGDGVSIEIEERTYYLCCSSCEALFREEYEKLRTAADGD